MNAEVAAVQAFADSLKVGERCNVRSQSYDAPMMREITFAGRETRKDGEWIVWRWKPESTNPEGRVDCGYSGFHVTRALNEDAGRILATCAVAVGAATPC